MDTLHFLIALATTYWDYVLIGVFAFIVAVSVVYFSEGYTAKTWLRLMSIITLGASGLMWYGIYQTLTVDPTLRLVFPLILTLVPPALGTFIFPWSPTGMWLLKTNRRTVGMFVIVVCFLFLLVFSFDMQYAFWSGQQAAVDTELVLQQSMLGIVGFIFVPLLMFNPITTAEIVERMRQDRLVRRYEEYTQGEMAILRNWYAACTRYADIGWENLTDEEREEYVGFLGYLTTSIQKTEDEIREGVSVVTQTPIEPKQAYYQMFEREDDGVALAQQLLTMEPEEAKTAIQRIQRQAAKRKKNT